LRAITAGRRARATRWFVGSNRGSSKNRTRVPRSWCQPSSWSRR
jgi:hypothetical protein